MLLVERNSTDADQRNYYISFLHMYHNPSYLQQKVLSAMIEDQYHFINSISMLNLNYGPAPALPALPKTVPSLTLFVNTRASAILRLVLHNQNLLHYL